MSTQQQEKASAAAGRGSPLLRRCKRERYTHGLRPPQMEALRAMCGALIPSLPVEGPFHGDKHGGGNKDDVERFYRASAADGAIPDEVAEMATGCAREAMLLVRVILWMLSTKVGTFVLCGWLCVSSRFPYVFKFADMPLERREEVLKWWSKTRWLFPLKVTFVLVKILSHYSFYTTVAKYSLA